jgi:methanogen homocitrate synthase
MKLSIDDSRTPSTANVLTGPFEARIDPGVRLWDNTLREGEQPPGVVFSPDEKLALAHALDDFGIRWATVGFPAVSKEEREAVRRITRAGLKMKTAGMARLVDGDIDAAMEAGVDLVALVFGCSDTHLKDKLRLGEAEALARLEATTRRLGDQKVPFFFAAEDASRTPLPRLLRMFQIAAAGGAQILVIADTAGILTPTATGRVVSTLKPLLGAPIGLHFHDDLGLALANALAGLEAGAEVVQVTVNGAGERSGNTCLEEMAVVLKVKYGLDFGFKLDRLNDLCERVHRASGTRPSEHKSITGKWCFTHESGIHVAGILANPETYQPYPPSMIGRHHEIVFGKHSGAQGVSWLADQVGVRLTDGARKEVLEKIKLGAERKEGMVTEEQIVDWIRGAAAATAQGAGR